MNLLLFSIGFIWNQANMSIFVFKKNSNVLFLLVYVEDIILIGNNVTLIWDFITRLNKEFMIKYLVKLNYFLVCQVFYDDLGIFSQSKYTHDILARVHLLETLTNCHVSLHLNLCYQSRQSIFTSHPLSISGGRSSISHYCPTWSIICGYQVSQFLHTPMKDTSRL